MSVFKLLGRRLLSNGRDIVEEVEYDPSGASGVAPAVTPTTSTVDLSEGGEVIVNWFPLGDDSSAPAIAIGRQGDDWPTLVAFGKPGDGVYFGDGTFDPTDTGVSMHYSADIGTGHKGVSIEHLQATLAMFGNAHINNLDVDGDITFSLDGEGPVVVTPDGTHTYRLGVDNSGAVIATLVA